MNTKTLEKLQRIYDQADSFGKSLMEKEFPELTNSEDERVIKHDIIEFIKRNKIPFAPVPSDIILDRWVSWLEKQGEKEETPCDRCRKEQPSHSCQDITSLGRCYMEGEQKPTDEFKPKFKVGDWIVEPRKDEPDYLWHIDRIENDTYWYDAVNAGVKVAHADKNYHLWTIQDVKDGDILEFADHGRIVIGIVSYVNKVTGKVDVNCLLEGNNFKLGNYYALDTIKTHPATKEQCNLLFQKLEEAGYEWDSEKRELKKIEQEQTELPNGEDYGIDSLYHAARILEKTLGEVDGYQSDDGILEHKCAISVVEKLYTQTRWSKKDDAYSTLICSILNLEHPNGLYTTRGITFFQNAYIKNQQIKDWLNSIKQRLTIQN